jgi:hypothetical protein
MNDSLGGAVGRPGLIILAGLAILLPMLLLVGCTPAVTPTTAALPVNTETPIAAAKLDVPTQSAPAAIAAASDTPLPTIILTATALPTLAAVESSTPLPTIIGSPTQRQTATPFPTLTYTPGSGRVPTRTPTATLLWPLRQRTPTESPTPTSTPTSTPTITLTPTPPFSYLRVSRPGVFSRVISPFRMEANVVPGEDGFIRVELVGEDGRLIVRDLLNNAGAIGQRFWFSHWLDFDITAAAETSRLILSVQDVQGRKIAISSVDLILLYLGENEINPPFSLLEPYVVWYPRRGAVIKDAVVQVGGLAQPINSNPLIVELIDEEGVVISSVQTQLIEPTGGEHTHARFEISVPYSVSETTQVRLSLRQESAERLPGTVALSSMLITLEPWP